MCTDMLVSCLLWAIKRLGVLSIMVRQTQHLLRVCLCSVALDHVYTQAQAVTSLHHAKDMRITTSTQQHTFTQVLGWFIAVPLDCWLRAAWQNALHGRSRGTVPAHHSLPMVLLTLVAPLEMANLWQGAADELYMQL